MIRKVFLLIRIAIAYVFHFIGMVFTTIGMAIQCVALKMITV